MNSMTLLDDAESELETSDKIIVLFHATYCPYCRGFKPEFEKAASASDLNFGCVDVTDNDSPYWDKYGIRIVPTVIVFSKGDIVTRADGKAHVGLDVSQLEDLIDEAQE